MEVETILQRIKFLLGDMELKAVYETGLSKFVCLKCRSQDRVCLIFDNKGWSSGNSNDFGIFRN